MKLSLAVVCLAVLAWCGHCSNGQKVAPSVAIPKYLPAELVVDPLLQKLLSALKTYESREHSQVQRIDSVISILNSNLDFTNIFKHTIQPNFADHQYEQNDRLDALEQQIAQIQELRTRVQNLTEDANFINDYIHYEIYPDLVKKKNDIKELEDVDREINVQIVETKEQGDAVNDKIDTLFEKSWDNLRELLKLKRVVSVLTVAVNSQNGGALGSKPLQVYPNNPSNATLVFPYEEPYVGRPQFRPFALVGFQAVKEEKYLSPGYPSLYFGVDAIYDNERVVLNGVDMSTGNWRVDDILVSQNEIYFGNVILPNLQDILKN